MSTSTEGDPPPPPPVPPPPIDPAPVMLQPKWFNTQRETFEPVKVHFAINDGDLDGVKKLIEKGISLDFCIYGHCPLTLAILKEHYNIAHVLVDAGASVDIPEQGVWKRRAIHLAAKDGQLDLVSKIHTHGADLNIQDSAGMTPLIWAATTGKTDTVKWLIQKGADINIIDKVGRSAIFRGVEGSYVDIVHSLYSAGADIEQQDDYGWTPLFHAVVCNDYDTVKELLSLGASTKHRNKAGQTVLHLIANRLANDNLLSMCRTDTNLYIRDRQVSCAASKHAINNPGYELPIAELLLDNGAYVNATDCLLRTPLYVAAAEGNADLVNVFVRAGADVYKETWVGEEAWPPKLIPCVQTCQWLKTQWDMGIKPLQDVCRILLRTILDKDINAKVHQLPLPAKIIDFLTL